jgi:hypothetical protein
MSTRIAREPATQVHAANVIAKKHTRHWLCTECASARATVRFRRE